MMAIMPEYSTGAAKASLCGRQKPRYTKISSANRIEILSTCNNGSARQLQPRVFIGTQHYGR